MSLTGFKRCHTQTRVPTNSSKRPQRLKTQPSLAPNTISGSLTRLMAVSQFNNQKEVRSYQQPHIVKVSLTNSNLKQRSYKKMTNSNQLANQEEYAHNNKYQLHSPIAQGSSSTVFLAHDHNNNKLAVKQIVQRKVRQNKELNLLKHISHPNIIQLLDYYFTQHQDIQYLHLVSQFYPNNLRQIIRLKSLQPSLLPLYLYQLLRGLNYLNLNNIIHRDLTPSNILVNSTTHQLLIADFGSAKMVRSYETNLSYVGSRAYRAPQLIFGSNSYSKEIDMWSFGCIAVEMATGCPPFKSRSTTEQMLQIMKKLGTPTQDDMSHMNPNYPLREFQILPKLRSKQLKDILNIKNQLLLDLLDKILVYSPEKRLTPEQAIAHPYFHQIQQNQLFRNLELGKSQKKGSQVGSQTKSIIVDLNYPNSPTKTRVKDFKFQDQTADRLPFKTKRVTRSSPFTTTKLQF